MKETNQYVAEKLLQVFVCPCLFQASVEDLSYLDTWESIV